MSREEALFSHVLQQLTQPKAALPDSRALSLQVAAVWPRQGCHSSLVAVVSAAPLAEFSHKPWNSTSRLSSACQQPALPALAALAFAGPTEQRVKEKGKGYRKHKNSEVPEVHS